MWTPTTGVDTIAVRKSNSGRITWLDARLLREVIDRRVRRQIALHVVAAIGYIDLPIRIPPPTLRHLSHLGAARAAEAAVAAGLAEARDRAGRDQGLPYFTRLPRSSL